MGHTHKDRHDLPSNAEPTIKGLYPERPSTATRTPTHQGKRLPHFTDGMLADALSGFLTGDQQ